MSADKHAVQTPVEDLLRSIPANMRLVIEEDPYGTRHVPIGRLCAEAVAEIATLRAQLTASEASRKELREALKDCEARLALLVASGRSKMLDAVAAEKARTALANDAERKGVPDTQAERAAEKGKQ